MFPATGSYALTERSEDISERQTVIWLILNACFWNPNAKNEMPFTLANYYLQEMLHITFIQKVPVNVSCRSRLRSSTSIRTVSPEQQHCGEVPAGALQPEVQWIPQGDGRCLRDQQGDRPACPSVRSGPIIEVLFEEIFAVRQNISIFAKAYVILN